MDDAELIRLAATARKNAYAPYSSFKVGAALLAENGEVFLGCNVENISFSLTMCAERVALGAAVQHGITSFQAVAVVSDSVEPVLPCGACRQVLAEFAGSMRVITSNVAGVTEQHRLDELLPRSRQGILG